MAWETLLLEKKENIGIITLNRPEKMNTMTPLFIKEYNQVLDEVAANREFGW